MPIIEGFFPAFSPGSNIWSNFAPNMLHLLQTLKRERHTWPMRCAWEVPSVKQAYVKWLAFAALNLQGRYSWEMTTYQLLQRRNGEASLQFTYPALSLRPPLPSAKSFHMYRLAL